MIRPLARLARAGAVLAAAALVLAGPPWALVRFTGWPLPRHVPAWPQLRAFLTTPLSDSEIITGLALVVWVLWALTVISLLIEAAAAVSGRPAPRLPVISPFQAAAAVLIAAIAATSSPAPGASPPAALSLSAALTASTATAAPAAPARADGAGEPAPAAAAPAPDSRAAPAKWPKVYRVAEGDSLWAIAFRFLGDGERWHELYQLNAGKPQPDGLALTDPDLIYPGWILLLPPPDTRPAGAAPPARQPAPQRTHVPEPSGTPHRHHPGGAPSPAGTGAHQAPGPVAVRLPSGSLIGISVAIMVAAALALARIQRRRRYRPRIGRAAGPPPGEPPLPAVIAALRRAARPAPPGHWDEEDGPDPGDPPGDDDPYFDLYTSAGPEPGTGGQGTPAPGPPPPAVIAAPSRAARPAPPGHWYEEDGPDPGDRPGDDDPYFDLYTSAGPDPGRGGLGAPAPGPPPAARAPAARAPGAIPLGVRGDSEAALSIAALGGLGLTGPGAPAAARAILTSLLAQARASRDEAAPAIIIPAADAFRLLPGEDPAGIPGVSVPATLEAALDQMEAAVLRQARHAGAPGDGDDPLAAAGDSGAPGPGAALIASGDHGTAGRLRGILESGRGYGAAAILLGPWPTGVTCQVAADGMITGVTPPGAGLEGIRLFHLAAADAAAITAVLREASGMPPAQPAAPAPAGWLPPARGAPVIPPGARLAASRPPVPDPAANGSAAAVAAPVPPGPGVAADAAPAAAAPVPPPGAAANGAGEAPPPGSARPAGLTMLGPVRITAAGKEIGGGLRKARELMAFLAVHPDGASGEAISEALWPGSDPGHAAGQRNLALRKARDMLRSATGLTAPMWIINASGRYRLDPNLISTDLWQFDAALDQARHAAGDGARLEACREAARLYRGELAEGEGYDWAEPHAETARRRALDAWTTIAEILQPADPDQALAALESALGHDPYNEFLYERIMRLQAEAGRPDAVRRTLSLLESRLTEIGVTPGSRTRQAAASLLGAGPDPRRQPDGPEPGPPPHERRGAR